MNDTTESKPKAGRKLVAMEERIDRLRVKVFVLTGLFCLSLFIHAVTYIQSIRAEATAARAETERTKQVLDHLLNGNKTRPAPKPQSPKASPSAYELRSDRLDIYAASLEAAEAHRTDPRLLRAVWWKESLFDEWAMNARTGATGLGQIHPDNYDWLIAAGVIDRPSDLLLDLDKAAAASAFILAEYQRRTRGNDYLAAAWYNAGPARAFMGEGYAAEVQALRGVML